MRARRHHRKLHRLSSIAATSVALVCLAGGRAAHAQSAEAEGLFNDGNKLMAEGQLAAACDAFEASNRIEPRAGTLIRLGECREQNHQLASAWSAYKDALTRVKDPKKRSYATARAAALEPKISRLTVSVPADSRIDGLSITRDGKRLDPMLWNRALTLDGGDYVIAARAAGREEWHTTAHVAVEGARVAIDVPRLKEVAAPPPTPPVAVAPVVPPPAAAAPAPADASAARSAERDRGDEPPRPSRLTTRRKWAIGFAGAGATLALTGAVFGALAHSRRDEAFQHCPPSSTSCVDADQANSLIAAAHRSATEANIVFGIAGAAAIGAVVLWLTGAPDTPSSMHVGVAPGAASGASLILEGSLSW